MNLKGTFIGVLSYATLCVGFVANVSGVQSAAEMLPPWVMAVAAMIVGPPVLFSLGVDAWPLVAAVLVLIGVCLFFSRLCWRIWPETEWFALWLFLGVLVWIGSPWLGVIVIW